MKRPLALQDTFALAGWLFADLLLGLSMIFLISNTRTGPKLTSPIPTRTAIPLGSLTATFSGTLIPWTPSATPTNTPRPTNTPTPTCTPTPTPVPPPMLVQEPVLGRLETNPARLFSSNQAVRSEEQTQVRAQIRQIFDPLRDEGRAGIVLTFGVAATPSEGGRLAREVNELLSLTIPEMFIGEEQGTVYRDFHRLTQDAGQHGWVELEVYFVAGGE